MAPISVYGLKNCDTCRKAKKALDGADMRYSFHDVRETPPIKAQIARWAKAVGTAKLLNKSSTTWRNLSAAQKEDVDDKKALALMAQHPTLIKRPVIENGPTQVFVGWSKDTQDALLK